MESYTILIADRNQHVRHFLKRELSREGYRIHLTGNAREVLKWAFGHDPLHLLIIDPDLPEADELNVLKSLEDRIPTLPIIIHGFISDYNKSPAVSGAAALVEKGGRSIELLKYVAAEVLQKANQRHPVTPEKESPPTGENLHDAG